MDYWERPEYERKFRNKPTGLSFKDNYEWEDAALAINSGMRDTPIGDRAYISTRFQNAVKNARMMGRNADQAVLAIVDQIASRLPEPEGGRRKSRLNVKRRGTQRNRRGRVHRKLRKLTTRRR
jgi:hypothetical protein